MEDVAINRFNADSIMSFLLEGGREVVGSVTSCTDTEGKEIEDVTDRANIEVEVLGGSPVGFLSLAKARFVDLVQTSQGMALQLSPVLIGQSPLSELAIPHRRVVLCTPTTPAMIDRYAAEVGEKRVDTSQAERKLVIAKS